MKSKLLIVACSILLSGIVQAADYKFDIKGQHAFIHFKVSHLGYSYILGGFNKFDGAFSHDAADPSASNAWVKIDAASIDTNHAERDKHLRASDFLDVEKYPEISFESSAYMAGSDGDVVKGKLSMHGVTRDIELKVRHIGEGKDPWGGYRSGFSGTVTLAAADYGLPKWVGNIDIEISIEGVRQ